MNTLVFANKDEVPALLLQDCARVRRQGAAGARVAAAAARLARRLRVAVRGHHRLRLYVQVRISVERFQCFCRISQFHAFQYLVWVGRNSIGFFVTRILLVRL